MAFCRNCGKELNPQAEICIGCGVRPPLGRGYCQSCGASSDVLAEVCIKCGVRLQSAAPARVAAHSGKSKVASVLLAVFLTSWTWLYTYKKDGWKFWTALGISVFNMLLIIFSLGLWIFFGWIVAVGIWIWAIVDVAVKGNEWYANYHL